MADAPSTYVKDAGTFKTVSGIEIKENGAWKRVVKGEINDNGTWKPFFVNKTTITIAQNTPNIDLDTHLELTANNGAGFLGDVDVIIDGDVIVFSTSTSEPAFKTGTKIEGILKLIFNGVKLGVLVVLVVEVLTLLETELLEVLEVLGYLYKKILL